ncbi:ASCH domain-containing protein [Laspinema olomoucense]|uniref:ASCH domain-containing protein n=1 Tax=Laspinema olomoucense D3b TaxID=2953688 RepID=A0ABT2N4K1_9CYAN|nr:ASCH domain-containing protein [Laspinema sp. D3b]MCT7977577.1 ASCH domain-containing protein [Laspinema sp. D3b]
MSPTLEQLQGLRAITLWQPWAGLIAHKFKQIETRSWSTDYRGIILIHSAKRPVYPSELEPFSEYVSNFDFVQDLGKIVAIAKLTDCVLMTDEFIEQQSELEKLCGNWQPGRYAWQLSQIQKIDPIPCPGKQGLWIPPKELIAKLILDQLI